MKTEEIIFWTMLAVPAIIIVIIFVRLLKEFNKLLKKAEKIKNFNNHSRPGTFYEVIIEPSSGCDISEVIKEMKSLSEIIGMPVCAEFNGKNLRITSATDVTHTVNCYWKGIDTDSVSQKS